jgi:CBS domain-containing protein
MNALKLGAVGPLALDAEFASDLMSPNPVSIRDMATIKEAVALLTDKGFSAAPVIDHAGRPIGVLSRADIVTHDREQGEYLESLPEYHERSKLETLSGERFKEGFQVEKVDTTRVCDIMTPVVFSVAPSTPAGMVVREMLALKVHRLFVVDHAGVLVGVISALDVLQHLN